MVWNHSLWLVLFQMHLSQKPVGLNCHVNVHFFLDGLIICWKIREDVHELCIWVGYDPYWFFFFLNQLLVIKFEIISGICQLVKLTRYKLFSSALLKENTCCHSIQINTCQNTICTVIIFFIMKYIWIHWIFFVYCANRVNNYRLLQVKVFDN